MRIEQYFILSVILSIAPVIGYIIRLYVKGELKSFSKATKFIRLAVIFYLLGIFVMGNLQPWILIVLVSGLILLEFMEHKSIFLVLGILFFIMSLFQNLIIYGTLGIFFYSLFYGIGMNKKSISEIYYPSLLFFASSSVFFIIALFV